MRQLLVLIGVAVLLVGAGRLLLTPAPVPPAAPVAYVRYEADPRRQALRLYWHDDQHQPLRSLGRLRRWLAGRGQRLVFAMNAGMFTPTHAPVGLYIEDFQTRVPLNTGTGRGNFYLKPNGVFYLLADGRAGVCETSRFRPRPTVRYATQSGPLLVLDGQIHPAFTPGSRNLNIRNGVGVLPNGHVLLAMSKTPVSLYDFAAWFRRQGCRQALYLDGAISRAYLPAQGWVQTDGDLGVLIGVAEPAR
ncbi:phosphodiester glycosidase family protein [Hymenobacter daecheongensis]|uniref:phosphodiester glycosidase family protein n=1 Tax=Hymenobacter daecheongensis TaxID=496053 RepID=UPI00135658B7|nr:phosphodiester glycosidase family protein [Hymenobacter daecheongensis]